MRPQNLKTKIFLDSGDPAETKAVLDSLGFLDGQTTNPSLVAKNPSVSKRSESGQKYTSDELYDFYKNVVQEISQLIPEGSVSVEVYADKMTDTQTMFSQGKEFANWIPNAHVKYPITSAGLEAASLSIKEKIRVNMTLCFSQSQAAAVYAATKGALRGDVFVSPFIGRLDDKGLNGVDLIANILRMYATSDGHSEVLSASVRTLEHFNQCLLLGSDIITAPFSVLKNWADSGMKVPAQHHKDSNNSLKAINYEDISLELAWNKYNIQHELTDVGLDKFANDWNSLLA